MNFFSNLFNELRKRKIEFLLYTAFIVVGLLLISEAVDLGSDKKDLYLNLGSTLIGSIFTIALLKEIIKYFVSTNKQKDRKDFLIFFGKTSAEKNFSLVFSKRTLSNENSKLFEYAPSIFDDYPVSIREQAGWKPPIPQGVDSWQAYEDLLVASSLGKLFGIMFPDRPLSLELILDDCVGSLKDPTIAIGLGFTKHSWDLYKLIKMKCAARFSIKWDHKDDNDTSGNKKCSDTDYFLFDKFNGKEFVRNLMTNSKQFDHSYAVIIRFVGCAPTFHFICAGLTASGTAAAGRFLAERWNDKLLSLYNDNKGMKEDPLTKSLAVLLKHPIDFKGVSELDTKDEKIFHIEKHFFF